MVVEQLQSFRLILDDLAKPALGLAQLARAFLHHGIQDLRAADLVLDVGAGAEPANHVAPGIAHWNCSAVVPAIDPVGAPEAVLDLLALPALQSAGPSGAPVFP